MLRAPGGTRLPLASSAGTDGGPYTRPMQFDTVEARVVGSLVEKELTTPQQYPLTLNALVQACNQTSNRDPVMDASETAVQSALDSLKAKRVVRFVFPSHGRSAVRYRHVLDEVVGLDERQRSLVAVLLLRGAQTLGELRTRTERMAEFDGLADVAAELRRMAERDEPLIVRLERRPGQKEERFMHLLAGPPSEAGAAGSAPAVGTVGAPGPAAMAPASAADPGTAGGLPGAGDPVDGALADLRAEVGELRAQVAAISAAVDELRASLGG